MSVTTQRHPGMPPTLALLYGCLAGGATLPVQGGCHPYQGLPGLQAGHHAGVPRAGSAGTFTLWLMARVFLMSAISLGVQGVRRFGWQGRWEIKLLRSRGGRVGCGVSRTVCYLMYDTAPRMVDMTRQALCRGF